MKRRLLCVKIHSTDFLQILNERRPGFAQFIIMILLFQNTRPFVNVVMGKNYNVELHCMCEQIKLLSYEIKARSYSCELIINTFLWHTTSPSLYNA